MSTDFPPLLDILRQIPDPRHRQGKRYPLSALLALLCVASLCGYKTYSAMAEWGRHYGTPYLRQLGFPHDKSPCKATLCYLLRRLDGTVLEAKLSQWAETVLKHLGASHETVFAWDGKTLRGSKKQGAFCFQLLGIVGHRLGLCLHQEAIASEDADKTHQLTTLQGVLESLLRQGRLAGRVWTMDALHTHRSNAALIVEGGGDYVLPVKENQKTLLADIRLGLESPLLAETHACVETWDAAHGRIEWRRLTASTLLKDYLDWPGVEQVFRIERKTWFSRSGQGRQSVVYGITSLSAQEASPERLLALVRGHWCIENRLHWIRDVLFDEDRSQVRAGNIPQVLAALRNTAMTLLRVAGEPSIATATRRMAAQPGKALALIGVT